MNPRTLLIVLVGLAAVVEDIGWRRISNWTSGGAVVGGLLLHLLETGSSGLGHSLLGAVLGFGAFLIFYVLGGMGGGDVKLMAGFGALLGNGQILQAALLAALCGGVMAVIFLAARGARREWLRLFSKSGAGRKTGNSESKSRESIPYAPAITAGAWLALISGM